MKQINTTSNSNTTYVDADRMYDRPGDLQKTPFHMSGLSRKKKPQLKIDPRRLGPKGTRSTSEGRGGGSFCIDAIFMWIPRTGGHSVIDALEPHGFKISPGSDRPCRPGRLRTHGMYTFKHGTFDRMLRNRHTTESYINRAYKFTFVRNPWDRVVSAACHEWVTHGRKTGVPDPYQMFDVIIDDLEHHQSENGLLGPWRCRPQATWLYREDGTKCYDFIGQHENQLVDLGVVCERLGLPSISKLPHISSRKALRNRPFHTPRSIAVVAEYERKLLELVPYTYEGS